jgi:hypothetical protein
MNYLHAWDPGGTTGYAAFNYSEDDLTLLSVREFTSAHAIQKWAIEHALEMWLAHDHTFVIEEFRLRPGAAEHLINNNMIAAIARGWVEMVGLQLGITQVTLQQPSVMKDMSNAFVKERLALSELPPGEHMKDALKHGVYWWLNWRNNLRRARKSK